MPRHTERSPRRTARTLGYTLGTVAAGLALLAIPGCIAGTLIGGMAESYRRTGSSTKPAEYVGIESKTFAVVTTAGRSIQAEYPGLIARVTAEINNRIANPDNGAGATAYIPSRDLLAELYNRPEWPALPPGEVADMLGVERLIYIELIEYRLNEPGNKYLWDGLAAGTVAVYEADSAVPDDPIFERAIRVSFPDGTGYGPGELPREAVNTALSNRFIDRCAWLFYEHEEPNDIEY